MTCGFRQIKFWVSKVLGHQWHMARQIKMGILQGKGTFYIENAFYLDAGLTLCYAIIHIAFPQHVLSLIVSFIE